jgi:3-oxoadipate enol-lactonase
MFRRLRAVPEAVANGIDVFYERWGEGPRLLFLNGSGATIATTGPLIKLFTGDFDTLVPDQRGLGATAVPPGPYEMGDYAADALALLDHVGWERARVVGISFGGMVAQELAVTAPERVERLALLCTSPGGAGGASYPLQELASLPEAEVRGKGALLLDTRFTPEWLETHQGDRMLAEGMAARRAGTKTTEERRGAAEQLGARSRHDVSGRLERISCPTLVACGRYDGIAPPSNSEYIASHIPGARLRRYEGGHAFFAQDRAAVPEVLAFLRGDGLR